MKKLIYCTLCFIGLASTALAQRIAVLEFNAGSGISQADVDGISAIFNTYFSPTGYTLVERNAIDRVIDEQNFQRGKFTQDQMVRIGEILNVSKIVVGDVNFIMQEYNVDVRIINVETGTISAKDGITWTPGQSYREMMSQLATSLANKIAIRPEGSIQNQAHNNQQSVSPIRTIMGYLKVFPNDLGFHDSKPHTTINNINKQQMYGYDNWRIPTNEELSLMKANNLLSSNEYMTQENEKGFVLLVTDRASIAERQNIISKKVEIIAQQRKKFIEDTFLHKAGYKSGIVDLGLPSGKLWFWIRLPGKSIEEFDRSFGLFMLPDRNDLIELFNNTYLIKTNTSSFTIQSNYNNCTIEDIPLNEKLNRGNVEIIDNGYSSLSSRTNYNNDYFNGGVIHGPVLLCIDMEDWFEYMLLKY